MQAEIRLLDPDSRCAHSDCRQYTDGTWRSAYTPSQCCCC